MERGEWEELLTGEESIQVDSGNNRTTTVRVEDILPKHLMFHNYKRQRERGLFKQLKREYENTNGNEDKILIFLKRYTKLKFKKYIPDEEHILFMIHISKNHPKIWKQVVEEDAAGEIDSTSLIVNVSEID